MSSRAFPKLVSTRSAPSSTMQTGRLVGLVDDRPVVVVGDGEPVFARCTVARPEHLGHAGELDEPVLLFLEEGDPARPIIVGFVGNTLVPARTLLDMPLQPAGATADGKRLCFEASEEVVLKCGKGSITLQANGRVVVKGTELVSRAEGSHKIRGATVSIN